MDGKISEQRVYCKIRAQLGFPPTEIHADLQNVYGNGALKYATVCKWVHHFNDGQESIENDPRVGRPVSVLTEKNIATVKTLIREDARYTVQEIEELVAFIRQVFWSSYVNDLGYVRSARAGCPICSLPCRNKVGLDLHCKL